MSDEKMALLLLGSTVLSIIFFFITLWFIERWGLKIKTGIMEVVGKREEKDLISGKVVFELKLLAEGKHPFTFEVKESEYRTMELGAIINASYQLSRFFKVVITPRLFPS
jgi:hypothetical protein